MLNQHYLQAILPMNIEVEANLRKMTEEERAIAESLLKSIAHVVYERGVEISDQFHDFDRVHRGAGLNEFNVQSSAN